MFDRSRNIITFSVVFIIFDALAALVIAFSSTGRNSVKTILIVCTVIALPFMTAVLRHSIYILPCTPLEICKKRNLFKLFYNDVSLLTESPLRKTQTSLDVLGLRTPARRGRITYLPIYMAGPFLNE